MAGSSCLRSVAASGPGRPWALRLLQLGPPCPTGRCVHARPPPGSSGRSVLGASRLTGHATAAASGVRSRGRSCRADAPTCRCRGLAHVARGLRAAPVATVLLVSRCRWREEREGAPCPGQGPRCPRVLLLWPAVALRVPRGEASLGQVANGGKGDRRPRLRAPWGHPVPGQTLPQAPRWRLGAIISLLQETGGPVPGPRGAQRLCWAVDPEKQQSRAHSCRLGTPITGTETTSTGDTRAGDIHVPHPPVTGC